MIKAALVFVMVFCVVYAGINLWRAAKKETKWNAIKVAAYSSLVACISLALLFAVVILF